MRIVLGIAVLGLGVGALGWWATSHNAPKMETEVAAEALQAIGATPHPLQLNVNGRDIAVSGYANSEQEKSDILAKLDAVDGRRVVVDDLTVLPLVQPFTFNAIKDENGIAISGNIPTEVDRALIAAQTGGSADTLDLAAGVPDGNWTSMVGQGVESLDALEFGSFSVEGQAISLSGLAKLPSDMDVALSGFDSLPAGYTLNNQVELEDDGTPMRLSLEVDASKAIAAGKLPMGMSFDTLSTALGRDVDTSDVITARISGPDMGWDAETVTGISALAKLDAGELTVSGTSVNLVGNATRQGRDAAISALADVNDDYTVSHMIELSDDGRPFQMSVSFDGTAATTSGKLPFGMSSDDVTSGLGHMTDGAFDIAELASENDNWPVAAGQGLSALSKLQRGSLNIMGSEIRLSGLAVTPDNGVQIANLLTNLPTGYSATTEFEYLDDGSAPDFSVHYRVDRGASVAGKLPAGLTAPDIAEALNLTSIESTATEGLIGAPEAATEALSKLSAWLPELDQATFSTASENVSVAAVASPGVDIELLSQGLAADFPEAIDIQTSSELPSGGSLRVNSLTGLQEQFTGVAWVPVFDFAATIDMCEQASADILKRDAVAFVTGQARLDAKSVRAINALAGLIRHCQAQTEFVVEVAGHTDSVGGADGNQRLSQARARSVLDGLVTRGVSAERITAVGYGETAPIADNATDAGRAANRRTEIKWLAQAPAVTETEGE